MAKTAILPVGPRGIGKTTYCKKATSIDQNTSLIIRDKIALALYGKTHFHQNHEFREEIIVGKNFWDAVKSAMQKKDIVVLDVWNANFNDRKIIIQKTKTLGFDRVICWYFKTPMETYLKWLPQKKDINLQFMTKDDYVKAYEYYYFKSLNIHQNGFDEIIEINPESMLIKTEP